MDKKDLTKLTESVDLKNLTEDCIALNDENAENLYGGWWDKTYNNCVNNNCKFA